MKINHTSELRKLYKKPSERAINKDIGYLDKHATNFIEHSPFCVISTIDSAGKLDSSPRGGQPGFVKVVDSKQLLIPDAKGNNRLDSLCNIVETQRIGMLFFIPGLDETLRVNGRASITTDAEELSYFEEDKFECISVIKVEVEEMFLHCAKAIMRSGLWEEESQMRDEDFPSMGQMLKDQLNESNKAESREETRARYSNEL